MRVKENKIVVAFNTTDQAIKMEKICFMKNISGRLIPVPKFISAGCGLAWCSAAEEKDNIKSLLIEMNICDEHMHECFI